MAGFVQTWRSEGGTKRPQWSCHSPASKAAGGAGRGHRGRGSAARSPRLPQHPRGRAEGGWWPLRWDSRGSSAGDMPAVRLEEWSHNRCRPEAAAAPRPSEVVQELDPDVPPVLISCYFQPAFHPAGWVAFSFQLPSPFRDRLTRCCAHPEKPKQGKTWKNLIPTPAASPATEQS